MLATHNLKNDGGELKSCTLTVCSITMFTGGGAMKKSVLIVALAVLFCFNAIGAEVHAVNYVTGTNTLFLRTRKKHRSLFQQRQKRPREPLSSSMA